MVSPDWEELFDDYVSEWFDEYDVSATDEISESDLERLQRVIEGGGTGEGELHDIAFSKVKSGVDKMKERGQTVPKFMENVSQHGLVKKTDKWIEFAQKRLSPIVAKEEGKRIGKLREAFDIVVKQGKKPDTLLDRIKELKVVAEASESPKRSLLVEAKRSKGLTAGAFREELRGAKTEVDIGGILSRAESDSAAFTVGRQRLFMESIREAARIRREEL